MRHDANASQWVFTRKILSLACFAGLMTAGPALAQQTGAAGAGAKAKQTVNLDAVSVTGSRISNPNIVSPTPLSVLTADDINATGATNIGDLSTTSQGA